MARRILLALFLIYFLLLVIHISKAILDDRNPDHKETELNKGWLVMVDGKEYQDVDLDDFLPEKPLKRGDIVVLRNTIPDKIYNPAVVRLEMYLTTVTAYVDNRIVYSYGEEQYKNNGFVGSGIHTVFLPDISRGKTITIKLKVAEDDGFTNIPAPCICHGNSGFIDYYRKNIVTVVSGLFLFVLGIVITIPSLIMEFKRDSLHRLTLIGLFSFCIGLWTCCNSRALQLLSLDITRNTVLEYSSLYFTPLPFALLVSTIRCDAAAWKRKVMKFIVVVFATFPVLALILHVTNIVHLPLLIRPFHAIALTFIILLGIVGVGDHTNAKESRYIDIGTIMMLTVSAMDIIRFNLQKYVAPEVKVLRISLIPFGVVLFVIILILSYLTYLYNILKEKASNESLRIMAYHDQLTGLYNRTKFEEMIEDYRDRKDMDYCLIIFDLDGLKITNDTYGHGMGDKLIKAFSDNVAASFEKYYNSTVMRIGGDEFVVMIDDVPDSEIKSRMEELHNLNVKSSEELGIPVRASYGYCAGKYTETGDPDEAYHLADSYMYTMKEAKKNSQK